MKLKAVRTATSLGLDNTFWGLEELVTVKSSHFGTRLVPGLPDSSVGKECACNAETLVQFLSGEDLLEKG